MTLTLELDRVMMGKVNGFLRLQRLEQLKRLELFNRAEAL